MKRFISWIKARCLWAVAVWLLVWQLTAMAVGQRLLLVSPWETLVRWIELVGTGAFWSSVLFSLSHILTGFLVASATGMLLAGLAARLDWVEQLLMPPLAAIRAVPVASFVIIALIWLPSRQLSVLISFLIALPVIYGGMLAGLRQLDPRLREMARVFHMPPWRKILYLHLPAALPSLRAALEVAMGLSWKSGVAAEVIGIPGGSIGEKLYRAKLYLSTPDLFAWTLTIVLLSRLCERCLLLMIDAAQRRLERM